jgi:GTP1/Obg family GTP-binding protein
MNEKIKKSLIQKVNREYKQYLKNTKDIKQIRENDKNIFDRIKNKIQKAEKIYSFYLYNY